MSWRKTFSRSNPLSESHAALQPIGPRDGKSPRRRSVGGWRRPLAAGLQRGEGRTCSRSWQANAKRAVDHGCSARSCSARASWASTKAVIEQTARHVKAQAARGLWPIDEFWLAFGVHLVTVHEGDGAKVVHVAGEPKVKDFAAGMDSGSSGSWPARASKEAVNEHQRSKPAVVEMLEASEKLVRHVSWALEARKRVARHCDARPGRKGGPRPPPENRGMQMGAAPRGPQGDNG